MFDEEEYESICDKMWMKIVIELVHNKNKKELAHLPFQHFIYSLYIRCERAYIIMDNVHWTCPFYNTHASYRDSTDSHQTKDNCKAWRGRSGSKKLAKLSGFCRISTKSNDGHVIIEDEKILAIFDFLSKSRFKSIYKIQ